MEGQLISEVDERDFLRKENDELKDVLGTVQTELESKMEVCGCGWLNDWPVVISLDVWE